MITCKYCGTELKTDKQNNTLYFCNYCDLSFEMKDTCLDRKRVDPIPHIYELDFYKPTKKLLKENTVILFHILAECRAAWYANYSLMMKLKSLEPEQVDEELTKKIKALYNEYIKITKQKFIIENILLEKAGFVPTKLTKEFLGGLLDQSKAISEKPMYIYVKTDKSKAV